MSEFKIRCSSLGRIMTEPRSKSDGPLSIGAKTAIREIAAQAIFGVDFEISSKYIEKGLEVEDQSIALLNRVRGLSLEKNKERRSNDFITGECDLFDAQRVSLDGKRPADRTNAPGWDVHAAKPFDLPGDGVRHVENLGRHDEGWLIIFFALHVDHAPK